MTTHLERRCRMFLALLIWPDGTRGYERELEDGVARLRAALMDARSDADEQGRRAIDQALTPWP